MQAIILAAGMGKRLKEYTADNTKCMVKIGNKTIIERTLENLSELNLNRIIIVTGYQADKLERYVTELNIATPIEFIRNSDYENTNNIYSLWLTSSFLERDDTIVIESDIVFEKSMLDKLINSDKDCITFVARPECWMNGSVVRLDDNNNIVEFMNTQTFDMSSLNDYYKTVSMYKFSKSFLNKEYIPFLNAYISAWGNNKVYESALKVIAIQEKTVINTLITDNEKWYEINDIQDIDIAESIFATGTDKVRQYLQRYGGYWRYPKMHDFCYLVNPYFPNERFINEMKANFDVLIREYPSGMRINSLLAGKYFEVKPEYICVGNGTAELIKSLIENLDGKLGMIYPTFEEYPHRKKEEDIIPFYVKDRDFKYSVDDIMDFYKDKDVHAIVLVNPDNPSGLFIRKPDILRLEEWAAARDTLLIVDESFIDFAKDEEWHTLLSNDILEAHHNLIVIKSISKSFGVAGLRLGVVATSDTSLISFMKKDVAIWNINSFAEYYLQIIEKYKDDYHDAMDYFKQVRDRYLEKLNTITQLKVYPSQANYVMCHITSGITSTGLADVLLNKYNILIKDLSSKDGINGDNFIRLSVKSDEENDILVNALKEIFQ